MTWSLIDAIWVALHWPTVEGSRQRVEILSLSIAAILSYFSFFSFALTAACSANPCAIEMLCSRCVRSFLFNLETQLHVGQVGVLFVVGSLPDIRSRFPSGAVYHESSMHKAIVPER